MSLNDAEHDSGGRLDPFLIAGPPVVAPGVVAGLDDFLADPPIPSAPAPAEPEAEALHSTPSPSVEAGADFPPQAPSSLFGSVLNAADLPIIAPFTTADAGPSTVSHGFISDEPSLIAAPAVVAPAAETSGAPVSPYIAAGVEEGGGGAVLSTLAANHLDDGLLADPSTLLSSIPFVAPSVADSSGSPIRFDSWSSDASWSGRAGPGSRFAPTGLDASPTAAGPPDPWGRGDDHSSSGFGSLDQVEGRLLRAVDKLEEAVAALSAPGPVPLGSRPRGFRGRIDA